MKRRTRWHGIALWVAIAGVIVGLISLTAFVRP